MPTMEFTTPERIGLLWTVEHTGNYLGIAQDAVKDLMSSNTIKSIYYRGQLRTTEQCVNEFIHKLFAGEINNPFFSPVTLLQNNHDSNYTTFTEHRTSKRSSAKHGRNVA